MLPICNVVRSFDFYHNISFVCWKHDHLDNFYLVGMRGLEFAHWTWRWWWGRLPSNCGSWWREMGEVSLSPPGRAHRQRRRHSYGLLRCIWDYNDDGVPKKICKAQFSSSVCTWKAAPGSSCQFSRPEPLSPHQLHTPEHASFAIIQVIILVNAIKLIQADLPFLWGELVHMVWEQVHSSDFGRVAKKKADLASSILSY